MNVASSHCRNGVFLASSVLFLQLVFALIGPVAAQEPTVTAPPAKVQQLIGLLDDPEVRQWLASKQTATPEAQAPSTGLASRLVAQIKKHLGGMRDAVPRMVPEWQAARERMASDMQNHGTMPVLRGFAFILFLGYGAEFLLRYFLRRGAGRSAAHDGWALNAFTNIAPLVAFAIVGIAAFVLSGWPPRLEAAVAPLLIAWIVARLLIAVASAVFKPAATAAATSGAEGEHATLAPDDARFWFNRSVLFICAFAVAWAIGDLMEALSFPADVRDLATAILGLVVLGLAIDTVRRRPGQAVMAGRRMLRNAMIVAFLVLLWLLWVAGMKVLFWIGIYVLGLPPLLRFTSATTRAILDTSGTDGVLVLRNVLIERGARLVIIALAAAWLAIVFRFNGSTMMQDDAFNRIFRGILAGVVILLAADLIWQLAKEIINLRVNQASVEVADPAQLARNMRMRTLLPILRNFLAAFIAVVAVLMVLSGLGVAIGPLIAGAGVFGVAIGFGSQTLVKDIISGIFYMMDDAFRVGEYIQSGSYMGTVESFSIRSVKLRHHRGPVFTVPFGSLGAVQNMSRDWVIDKFKINVSYDTDVAKVKKVVKGVGAALLEDPELAPLIIETVKMKGVEQFGDYGVTLSFAMTTKPGHQTQVRRRAQALIKEAFKTHGISFASPTVQVAGDEAQSTTVAAAATRDAIAKKNAALAQAQGAPTE
ncbi:mechanosensitive ion channel family protein [Sinorhizobium sp. 7-81]|uniref:mechanosensitive ion channel family protein n=1 Tax=Sinorhizobium sp. 8-89 TaxID=3049089 RepID=UPI0024C26F49|nr:mechanosensitive ion channel family protein [Sinorhizobium sp. 8-89]MDK1493761.1 mechanosensitive ion channel family protein [Sinorhizobium sp. 8-89]